MHVTYLIKFAIDDQSWDLDRVKLADDRPRPQITDDSELRWTVPDRVVFSEDSNIGPSFW